MEKSKLILPVVLVLAIAGCKVVSHRQKTNPPLPPPLPSASFKRLTSIGDTGTGNGPSTTAFNPSDFALTSIRAQQNKVVLTWQNGTPPFQPQSKPDVLSAWQDFGPSTMQRSVTNPAPYGFTKAFFRVSTAATPGSLVWLRSTTNAACVVNGIKADAAGNVIVIGTFYASVNIGGIVLVSAGNGDAFLAKYNSAGSVLWATNMGGLLDDFGTSVSIDSQNNIVAVGYFTSPTMNLGGGPIINHGVQSDAFVTKRSSSGQHLWSKGYGGVATDFATSVGVDAVGNVFVSSKSGNVVDFGNGIILTGAGGFDIALAKFAGTSGTTLWATLRGGGGNDIANALSVDGAGDVALTGEASDGIGGGPGSGFFVAKYSGVDGAHRWSRFAPGGIGNGIANDAGKVITTGRCSTATDFGGGPIGGGSANRLFLTAYTASGGFLWSRGYGADFDIGYGVALDASGNIALTGEVNGAVDFGGGFLFGNGSRNCFIVTFAAPGNSPPVWRWNKRARGATSGGNCTAMDGFDHVLNGGHVTGGTADFGDGNTVTGSGFIGSAFTVQYAK